MAEDSKEKNNENGAQKDNNEEPKHQRNKAAKTVLKCQNTTGTNNSSNEDTDTGAAAFAQLFNNLAREVKTEIEKEENKPQYRFYDIAGSATDTIQGLLQLEKDYSTGDGGAGTSFIGMIDEIEDELDHYGYEVKIVEDLEVVDVTEKSRYEVVIYHKSGVYITFDLLEYENKVKNFEFDETAYIEALLAKLSGAITEREKEVAVSITEYLAYLMYFKSLYTLRYSKIGWQYYDWGQSGWMFKYDKIYTKLLGIKGQVSSKDIEGLGAIVPDDQYKEKVWVDNTIDMLKKHSYCGMLLGAGISGLLRQLLPFTKETNININIKGEPASGKSTIGHYILAIFGNPEMLEGSFSDTENAVETKRTQRPVLPYILDDRMLSMADQSEKIQKQKILLDVFREYEGKSKERLGKQYKDDSGNRTYGPVISSSVKSMMELLLQSEDLGQFRRFMEFDIGSKKSQLLFSDAEEAKKTEELAYKNYGYGVGIIVDYILALLNGELETVNDYYDTDADEEDKRLTQIALDIVNQNKDCQILIDRFNSIDKQFEEALKQREKEENDKAKAINSVSTVFGLDSSSKRFALIVLSYKILRESLLYHIYSGWKDVDKVDLKEDNIGQYTKDDFKDLEAYYSVLCDYASEEKSFKEFCVNNKVFPDDSANIGKILIDNLVDKAKRNDNTFVDDGIYDYVMNNLKYFVKVDKVNSDLMIDLCSPDTQYIGYYKVISENVIELYTQYNAWLEYVFEMDNIPKAEDILEFCREINRDGLNKKEIKQKAVEKLGARKETRIKLVTETKDITDETVWYRKAVSYQKKPIMVSVRVLARSQSEEL